MSFKFDSGGTPSRDVGSTADCGRSRSCDVALCFDDDDDDERRRSFTSSDWGFGRTCTSDVALSSSASFSYPSLSSALIFFHASATSRAMAPRCSAGSEASRSAAGALPLSADLSFRTYSEKKML